MNRRFQSTPDIQAVVFDAYGTLLDVGSLVGACAAVAADAPAFLATWRAKQLEYAFLRSLMGRYADFWQVTAEALDHTAERVGLRLEPAVRQRLLAAWLAPAAYPEAAACLRRLAGRPLAVLSNGSPAMLAAGLAHAGLAPLLTHVLSVDEVGLYKPAPAVYALAPRHLGLPPGAILFVSGNAWDAAGGASFGFQVAWLDRAGLPFERLGSRPALTVGSLTELADRLGAPA